MVYRARQSKKRHKKKRVLEKSQKNSACMSHVRARPGRAMSETKGRGKMF